MEKSKVDMFIMLNAKYFPSSKLMIVKQQYERLDDNKAMALQMLEFKDPTMLLIVSLFVGHFGIDRFMLGDTGAGIGKLLTCGGLGIWTIVDFFLIMDATRDKNFNNFMQMTML